MVMLVVEVVRFGGPQVLTARRAPDPVAGPGQVVVRTSAADVLLIAANGIGSGMFASPNSSSIMGSVPARQRGAASGMRSTFQNSGTALSIGVFFSVMIAGLASRLPVTLASGLRQHCPARRPPRPARPARPGLTRRTAPAGPSGTVLSSRAAVGDRDYA
jgi:hypothetical protein